MGRLHCSLPQGLGHRRAKNCLSERGPGLRNTGDFMACGVLRFDTEGSQGGLLAAEAVRGARYSMTVIPLDLD
jgi:hypothetical protein